jgi:hypothetical protein
MNSYARNPHPGETLAEILKDAPAHYLVAILSHLQKRAVEQGDLRTLREVKAYRGQMQDGKR